MVPLSGFAFEFAALSGVILLSVPFRVPHQPNWYSLRSSPIPSAISDDPQVPKMSYLSYSSPNKNTRITPARASISGLLMMPCDIQVLNVTCAFFLYRYIALSNQPSVLTRPSHGPIQRREGAFQN